MQQRGGSRSRVCLHIFGVLATCYEEHSRFKFKTFIWMFFFQLKYDLFFSPMKWECERKGRWRFGTTENRASFLRGKQVRQETQAIKSWIRPLLIQKADRSSKARIVGQWDNDSRVSDGIVCIWGHQQEQESSLRREVSKVTFLRSH